MSAETGFAIVTDSSVAKQEQSTSVLRFIILSELNKIEHELRQLKDSGASKCCPARKELIRNKRRLESQLRQQKIHDANKKFRQEPYFA
ncbi:MAG: hypothetical protein ACKKL5_01220 [Candidatus Komeilibacteria bacterium]